MVLLIVAFLGGVLTIVSPCILPVIPFVFARSDRPFRRGGLPVLVGMALTFAIVASLAAVGGSWVVDANQYGRWAAMVVMAVVGLSLVVPSLAARWTRPLVAMGARLSRAAASQPPDGSVASSLLLGVATGLLWTPCAGPVLGLVLTGAALNGANLGTSLLLLAFGAGAAISLAVALLIGGRLLAAAKRSLGVSEWIRRGLGLAVLAAVVAIGLGLDTGLLTRISVASTNGLEQALVRRFHAAPSVAGGTSLQAIEDGAFGWPAAVRLAAASVESAYPLPGTQAPEPSLQGAVDWLNSRPLTLSGLRGHVVLVDFWTYSCINCLRALPYVKAWARKYRDKGLVVIGVHTPEFAFEKDIDNVKGAVSRLGIHYPVAIDNNYAIWRSFQNQYWPADYLFDDHGQLRHHQFGEGGYAETERQIQALLREAGDSDVARGSVSVSGRGAEAPADMQELGSPETYIGAARAERMASPGGFVVARDHTYSAPSTLARNQWALTGAWRVGLHSAVLVQAGGGITYRFHARDLHLVLGPTADGSPVRFRVTIDGHTPGADHGVDVDAAGNGIVNANRLYQLVRLHGAVADHVFEIQFLDPGVAAYSFTFG